MLSRQAGALLRCLMGRVDDERNRILLSSWVTVDWHSLTFAGERHQAAFRIIGEDGLRLAERFVAGLEEAELPLGPSAFVAELAISERPAVTPDGSVSFALEALTLRD